MLLCTLLRSTPLDSMDSAEARRCSEYIFLTCRTRRTAAVPSASTPTLRRGGEPRGRCQQTSAAEPRSPAGSGVTAGSSHTGAARTLCTRRRPLEMARAGRGGGAASGAGRQRQKRRPVAPAANAGDDLDDGGARQGRRTTTARAWPTAATARPAAAAQPAAAQPAAARPAAAQPDAAQPAAPADGGQRQQCLTDGGNSAASGGGATGGGRAGGDCQRVWQRKAARAWPTAATARPAAAGRT